MVVLEWSWKVIELKVVNWFNDQGIRKSRINYSIQNQKTNSYCLQYMIAIVVLKP